MTTIHQRKAGTFDTEVIDVATCDFIENGSVNQSRGAPLKTAGTLALGLRAAAPRERDRGNQPWQ
jgi:hypothetical protein